MAFVTLEDLYGFVEVIVFSDVYKEAEHLIQSDKPLLIRGDIDKNESSSKLIASEIIDLSMAKESEVDLVEFDVKSDDEIEDKLLRLKDIMLEHPGRVKADLVLRVKGKGTARIRISERYQIKPSQFFINAVNGIFGNDTVKLKMISKRPHRKVSGQKR